MREFKLIIESHSLCDPPPQFANTGLSGTPKVVPVGGVLRQYWSSQTNKYHCFINGDEWWRIITEIPPVVVNGVTFSIGSPVDSTAPDFAAKAIAPAVADRLGIAQDDATLLSTCTRFMSQILLNKDRVEKIEQDEADDGAGKRKGNQPSRLDQTEIDATIDLLSEHFDEMVAHLAAEDAKKAEKAKKAKKAKAAEPVEEEQAADPAEEDQAAEPVDQPEWMKRFTAIKQGRTPNLSTCLIGRLNTSVQDQTVQGCFQVAASLGVTPYQSVSDLNTRVNTIRGSGEGSFMCHQQLASSTLYRYFNIDLTQFVVNVAKAAGTTPEEAAPQMVEAIIGVAKAFVIGCGAVPRGGISRTAHDVRPSLTTIVVRTSGHSNWSGAFRRPIVGDDPVAIAAARLDARWNSEAMKLTESRIGVVDTVTLALDDEVEANLTKMRQGGVVVANEGELLGRVAEAIRGSV